MVITRIDEASFHRRPWGVLEDYLGDRKLGAVRRVFVQKLGPNELLALVSKNGMQVIFVRGFDHLETGDGSARPAQALVFIQIQLDRQWTLPMLQELVKHGKIPFKIENYKRFEDIFPSAVRAAKAVVRKGVK